MDDDQQSDQVDRSAKRLAAGRQPAAELQPPPAGERDQPDPGELSRQVAEAPAEDCADRPEVPATSGQSKQSARLTAERKLRMEAAELLLKVFESSVRDHLQRFQRYFTMHFSNQAECE